MPNDDVLALVDEGGRVIEWRRPAEELFGWSAEQAVGRSVTALLRELATDGEQRRERLPDLSAVQVKPVLRGASVLWQVHAAEGTARGQETPEHKVSGWDVPGQDLSILEAVFAHSPVGMLVLDERLRVVRTSSTAGGLRVTPAGQAEHLPGAYFTEACAFEDAEEEAVVAGRVLGSGKPEVNRTVRVLRAPGRPRSRTASVSYFRLADSHGDAIGVVAYMVDVTERESAQQRLAFLEAVRSRVGHRLNVMHVCQELVEAVVPAFADVVDVEVIEDVVRGEDPPPTPVRPDLPLRRAAFRGGIGSHPAAVVRALPAGTPFSHVLSDLRPRLVSLEKNSSWQAADPERADIIERSGARSLIVAPLAMHGQTLGVVSFYRGRQQDPFEQDDITVACAVCGHAALCINNARLFMREWMIASTVQRRLLPQHPAAQATVEVAPLRHADPQGGSAWFDTIALPCARTALIVGNVAGQGIAAAVTMGLLRTALHTLAALDLEADELLARLSDTAARLVAARASLPPTDPLSREPLIAGCIIAIHDPVDLTCTIARSGLPEPAVILPDGTPADLSVPPGPPLAAADNAPFPATTVSIPEGTTLAMGTATLADQLLAPSGPLRPLLYRTPATPLPDIRDTLAGALSRNHPTGETLLLLARTKALPADQVLTCDLPAGPEAAPIARAATRRQLDAWKVDEETAFTTELIVSEFVGNAVRHGTPPLRLRLLHHQKLTCEVTDAAASAPQVKHARTIDETGRGLHIVATLADQWGTRYQPQGKTVWAEQPTGASTAPP
ncbi:SpoIIE family protein phosphatase [Streptomyces sp. NPDC089424]|uniref:ATP-binding SpoIIE family protein phosphatase n=1 Tax=Streptomyces sp. NPDC089424 TaxID=3365917 RepID=UPI00380704C3